MADLLSTLVGTVAPVVGAATGLGSGAFNVMEQRKWNERTEANAWDMFQTERRDADSAHQREVADLKKAGLNPILSATKGAGAPVASGTAAPATAAQVNMPDLMGYFRTAAELENMRAQNELLESQKTNVDADTLLKGKTIPGGIIQDLYRNVKDKWNNSGSYIDYLRKMYELPKPKLNNKKP